ncbi:MAG: hypothetical protein K9M96_17350 [Deltaproteobacteria bacterium]|nr:hypothetical protein [Deltaproteobacteria bacterium]
MEQIIESLFSRLVDKGLAPEQIPGLLRDVGNTLQEDGNTNAYMISERLVYLGWDEEMVDEYLFQLILPILHRKGGLSLKRESPFGSPIPNAGLTAATNSVASVQVSGFSKQ